MLRTTHISACPWLLEFQFLSGGFDKQTKRNLVFISFVVRPLCVLREPYFLIFLLCSKPCPLPHFTQNKNRSPNTAPRPQVTWLPCPPCHHWLLSLHTLCLSSTLDPPQTRAGLRAFALLLFTLEYSSLDAAWPALSPPSGLSHLHPDHLIHHCKSRLLPACSPDMPHPTRLFCSQHHQACCLLTI